MAIYRGLGGAGSNEQDASISVITTKALEAATSATNAATSETNAAASAVSSAASATSSQNSATSSATSATNAAGSAANAATSEANASFSEANAAASYVGAYASETNAASSAAAAATSETNAATSASSALAIYGSTAAVDAAVASATASASAASTSETNAATSETNAATSASAASTSATNAASSASSASSSATTATTKASEASASATSAASSATTATTKASEASASAAAALTSETNASTSETNAASSAANASSSETNAATSATNSANSATAAAASQTAAATSATNASNSASAASTSETNAAASASAASASEAAAAASYDAFDDRYLGSKTSDPSVDNDGNTLLTGALYFDSVTGVMKVWSGTNWIAAYASLSGAMFSSNNLSDVASIPTARSNLGLGTTSNVVFNQLETTNGLIVGGDLTVNGTLSTINTENLAVSDNMIYLNDGSTVTNPDLGWAGNYNDGTYAHAGVFRDATDGKFKFYDGYTPEPGTEINTGHASFTLADVQAGTFFGALSGNASTATALATSRTIGLTGDVSGSVSFNGTADATITAVVADDSHNHIISNVDGLQAALDTKAPLASPGLTGTPTAPTAVVGTNTTQVATTAFVNAEIANDAPTKTGGGASGTWGINITGNAATATSATTASSVPYSGLTGTVPTWNQNTTGNAATATYATTAGSANAIDGVGFTNTGSNNSVNADTIESNGISYYGAGVPDFTGNSTDGALYSQAYSSDWQHQIAGDYRSGQIALRGKNNSTWQSWRTVLDSGNYNNYAPTKTGGGASGTWGISITGTAANTTSISSAVGNGYTWTAANYFRSNGDTSSSSSPPLQAYSDNGSGAIMSFHRGSNYAVNMGLDSDNVFRIGGWSASANRLQMDMSGNLTMAGNVTAYSDERLKKDWEEVQPDFIEQLSKVKSGTYTRIDNEERQAGVSAQSLRTVLPETVITDADGTLAVAYGNAAMVSVVELAKEIIALREEIEKLRGV